MARPDPWLTRAAVRRDPDLYLIGPGYDDAHATRCDHDRRLTEPCAGCDGDDTDTSPYGP